MSGTWHVYPANDLLEHDTESDECLCGPTIEPVPREDGSMGWVVKHHSLDGREEREREAHIQAQADGEIRVASEGTDAEWCALTGNCGHCGVMPCECSDNDPCECLHLHPESTQEQS